MRHGGMNLTQLTDDLKNAIEYIESEYHKHCEALDNNESLSFTELEEISQYLVALSNLKSKANKLGKASTGLENKIDTRISRLLQESNLQRVSSSILNFKLNETEVATSSGEDYNLFLQFIAENPQYLYLLQRRLNSTQTLEVSKTLPGGIPGVTIKTITKLSKTKT
jgi:phenylalanyl-tRNA synthetase alpha subunit